MLAPLADILLPGGGWIVNFAEFYVDESGTHDDSEILSVAGYLFEKSRAIEFDEEWKKVLDDEGLPYFRMSACAHQTEPFENKSIPECDMIERKIIALTKDKSIFGFAINLNETEYDSIGPKHSDVGSAYSFCLRQCLTAIRSWVRESGFDGEIAYFFEAGHRHQSEAGRIMERVFRESRLRADYRYSAHAFADKAKTRPLQAADLLAWQWHTDARRKRAGVRVTRKDLQALVRPQDLAMDWTAERLADFAACIADGTVTVF